MQPVTSRDNRHVKELSGLLADRKRRRESGLFVAEGARLCLDVLDSGIAISSLILSEHALERYPQTGRIADAAGQVVVISRELAQRVSDTRQTQGVFCICRQPDQDGFSLRKEGKYLFAEGLQDPGNLGTVLRTAQALGVDGVFACNCPELYAPKVLRSAMGGLFRLPVRVCGDAMAMAAELRQAGIPLYAAALTEDAAEITQVDVSGGCAVLIGNEGKGLSGELIAACDGSVIIPMQRDANSLNAAAAAAILLWEMTKSRLEAKNQDSDS